MTKWRILFLVLVLWECLWNLEIKIELKGV